jgi:transposase
MAMDPFGGALFVFYNRDRTAMKILCYDGQGFCLFAKRLSKGKFVYNHQMDHEQVCKQICYRALNILINNGDPASANLGSDWRTQRVVVPREESLWGSAQFSSISLDPV